MRIWKWMMGIKRIEKIRTKINNSSRAVVANISEKTREARLRWLGENDM